MMKKLLLGTTVLAGLYAGAAYAEGPTVTVGGFLDFQVGGADQDLDTTDTQFGRDVKFQNDTEIHVKAEGKTDAGLTYGAVVELEADVSSANNSEGVNADKTYLFLESGFGRLEMGNNTDAAEALAVDASNLARATGGINGDYYYYANLTRATLPAAAGAFILSPDLPTAHMQAVAEDATKLTYYTPRFSGVQFGASYTPDQGNGGSAAGFTTDTNGNYEDVFNLGLNYAGQFDQLGVQAAVTGEFAQNELSAREDLEAYNAGLLLSYAGFSVAGSYGDWQGSTLATTTNQESDYWTAGAGYEQGPFGVSLTYMESSYGVSGGENELDLVSLGADYQAAPGLVPYVEVNWFDADAVNNTYDNEGTVVIAGAELTF